MVSNVGKYEIICLNKQLAFDQKIFIQIMLFFFKPLSFVYSTIITFFVNFTWKTAITCAHLLVWPQRPSTAWKRTRKIRNFCQKSKSLSEKNETVGNNRHSLVFLTKMLKFWKKVSNFDEKRLLAMRTFLQHHLMTSMR